ncbi:MAG: sialate O-acetylesterase [Rubrivivax sp.]
MLKYVRARGRAGWLIVVGAFVAACSEHVLEGTPAGDGPGGERQNDDASGRAIGGWARRGEGGPGAALALDASIPGYGAAGDAASSDGETSVEDPADSGDASVDVPIDTAPPFVSYDINQVLTTGQSLAVGAMGDPVLSPTQPFDNLMFGSGVYGWEFGLWELLPLVEDWHETMSSGFANHVSLTSQTDFSRPHTMLVSIHAAGGTPYSGIKKGTFFYDLGIKQAAAGHARAADLGKTHVVRAVTIVHGESDAAENNTHYADDMIEFQKDYETDVTAATGQSLPIPLIQTQMSAIQECTIPLQQLDAHLRAPGKVILVGPKYHLPYADPLHLTNHGYFHMGEDYAKVYRRVILEGGTWEPLRPKSITRSGDTITVVYYVPAPPLAIDDTLVPATPGRGFVFTDGTDSPPTVTSVSVVAPDTVRIVLSQAPAGPGTLSYALATDPPRGNIRDSDATPSRGGYALYNWSVQFRSAVP